jgi:transposase, IS5 family
MRVAFASQQRLDCQPIVNIQFNLNCRDEIIPILTALQHLYSQPEVRDEILKMVAQDVNGNSNAGLGRTGLDYWQILVLAAVRLGCNLNYDKLQNLAEEHRSLRHIMGIGDWEEDVTFDWRRIRDNICLIHPETLERINHAIVAEGHKLVPDAADKVRVDSFVMETNIHYPTESTLIRDGLRKIFGLCVQLAVLLGAENWRQHKHLYRKAKRLSREIDRIAARKGNNYEERLKRPYRQLLDLARTIMDRAGTLRARISDSRAAGLDSMIAALNVELGVFLERTEQVCGTAERRVLNGENVPNSEKLFSIFESHTQLLKRGKAGQPIQFGRMAMVFEDQAGFVCHYYVVPRDAEDRDVAVPQTRILQERLGGRIKQVSFDRGFHSPENQQELTKIVAHLCLPMPGVNQAKEQRQQATAEFRQARQRHPGIESAIGALQSGNGLVRSRDRTERGYTRYLGLGVLGRNLHVLGKILIAREDASCKAGQSRRDTSAA